MCVLDDGYLCPYAEFWANQAVSIMAEYIKTHPDFVAGVVAWLIVR